MKNLLLRFWRQSGLNQLARNNYQRAYVYFQKVYDREPHVQGSSYNLAVSLMGLKRYSEAEPLLIEDLQRFGEEFTRFRGLGDLYYFWEKPEKAKSWYAKALKVCDSGPESLMLSKRMEICSSPEAFLQAAESRKAFDEGNFLIAEHQYEQAIEAFQRSAERDETNFLAWNNMGTIYFIKLKDPKRAMEAFARAAVYSSMPSLLSNLETVKRALGQS